MSEIEHGVSGSRSTVVVLSPACLADRWAAFGEQPATHAAVPKRRLVPLLHDCDLPLRLDFRVALAFRDGPRCPASGLRWRIELSRCSRSAGMRMHDARCAMGTGLSTSTNSEDRAALRALDWAAARLQGSPDAAAGRRMIDAYRSPPPGATLRWAFTGTRDALRYGPRRQAEVEPLLRGFAALEPPVSDEELARLRTLVTSPPPAGRNEAAIRGRGNRLDEAMPQREESHATR